MAVGQAEKVEGSDYSQLIVDALVSRAKTEGDFRRGLEVYTRAKAACFSCHKIGAAGGVIGPELSTIGKMRTEVQIAESLLWPNRTIAPEYMVHKILTVDGEILSGYLQRKVADEGILELRDPTTGKSTIIEEEEIEEQTESQSLMPNGLFDSLSAQEQSDLLVFLLDLGTNPKIDYSAMESVIKTASTHEPTTFPLTAGPMYPERRPAHGEYVNRNRVYDFYSKQAEFFLAARQRPAILEEFPGLDGKGFGHWGNQTEDSWRSGAWNKVDLGTVLCNAFITRNKTVPRGVCFRFGDAIHEWAACFNPDTLGFEAVWKGGFVTFSDVRHGFIDGVRIDGTPVVLPSNAGPIQTAQDGGRTPSKKYRGYYRHGERIVFSYSIDGVEFLDSISVMGDDWERIADPRDKHPDRALVEGGQTQWPQEFATDIELGSDRGLTVDTIGLPTNNPWNVPLFCGDHGFLSDGSAIVVTMHGDVWRVSGISYVAGLDKYEKKNRATWRRIASGLHHPLGVVVHEDQIYVLGRNQITRLHDLNGDLEIDWYECFSDAFETSPAGHDYVCGLQRDRFGNFYTASGNQGVLQITPDGETARVIGTGFRNPDGIGILPDGTLTVPCSEGEWTPTSMICQIEPIRTRSQSDSTQEVVEYETTNPPFYGYRGPRENQSVNLPLLYLPRGLDNSSGGQLFVEDARMGPLDQHIVHSSFGAGTSFLILRDRVGAQWQGAAVQLPGEFRSGVHRIHANPRDGQLYFTGMNGWGSYTPDAGCFQRLRYTGDPIQLPIGFHVHAGGISVRFNLPLDPVYATDPNQHFAQCWNYRYTPGYGSKEFSLFHPPMVGHDSLSITSSHIVADGKTLFLEIPGLQLTSQLHLRMNVDAGGAQELVATIHAMDDARKDYPGYKDRPEFVRFRHPMDRDLEWLQRSIPNPWRTSIAGAREIRIEARDNLQFSTKRIEVIAGEAVKLTFANPDVVPHNWALLRQGTLDKIGELTNRLVTDPEAYLRHYVPASDDVLCYTDVVEPGGSFSIFFTAPNEPGRYPYLCTFPGHWMVMNGELEVMATP